MMQIFGQEFDEFAKGTLQVFLVAPISGIERETRF